MIFGNVTSLVGNTASNSHVEFFEEYNKLSSKLKNEKIPEKILQKVRFYFDS